MKLNQLEKLMKMAYLDLLPEEKVEIREALEVMICWMNQLNEVNTKGVIPLTTMSKEKNQFSVNQPLPSINLQEALANAPLHDGTYFHLPIKSVQKKER